MVLDAYTGVEFVQYPVPHESMDRDWSLHDFHGWYDLIVRVTADAAYECRLTGHMETGRDSMTYPALGGLTLMD